MEWRRIGKDLKVRAKLVGGYWEVISKDSVGCKVLGIKKEVEADTVANNVEY